MTIEITGVLEFLKVKEKELNKLVRQALVGSGKVLIEEESTRTKGKLSKSFAQRKLSATSIEVFSRKPYAYWIENGRGPVRAINAQALRFVINGEVLFRKSVGPAAAQPFVEASILAAAPRIHDIFIETLKS